MTTIDRAVGLIEAMIEHDVEILAADPADTDDRTHGPAAIAQALADAGLITPGPRIIRTREELADLDGDTLLIPAYQFNDGWESFDQKSVFRAAAAYRLDLTFHGPAVVLATGDETRAAQQAIKEEE